MRESWQLAVVAALPILALGLALFWAIDGVGGGELVCRVAPNGRILRVSSECPVHTNELVRSIYESADDVGSPYNSDLLHEALARAGNAMMLGIAADGGEARVRVSIHRSVRNERLSRVGLAAVLSALLLMLPIGILRGSSDPSALPLALLSSVTATIATTLICGANSLALNRLLVVAGAALPAVTAHLGLAFPRVRKRLIGTPLGSLLPYGTMFVFGLAALSAFERNSGYWPIVMWTIGVLEVGAWALLVSTCAFAVRESRSPVEKTRAKLLGLGALIMPAMATLFFAPRQPSSIEILSAFLASASASLTVPVALAVSRYNLFSLGDDLRRLVARTLYTVVAGGAVGLLWTLVANATGKDQGEIELLPFLFSAIAMVGILEPVRSRVLGFFEGYLTPSAGRLASVQADFAHGISELHGTMEVASLLAASMGRGIAPRGGWIYLSQSGRLVPTAAVGSRSDVFIPEPSDVQSALGADTLLQLAEDIPAEAQADRRLKEQGASLLIRLEHKGETLGVVALGPPDRAMGYSRQDLDFARSVAGHASVALHNALLTEDLLLSESEGARATFATGLLHDLGKEISWIRMIAGRLPKHLDDESFVRRDIAKVLGLSKGLSQRVGEFLSRSRARSPKTIPISRAIERSIEAASRIHGLALVDFSASPDARVAHVDGTLIHVVTNLVDNAIRASKPDDPVRVCVTTEGETLVIAVIDEGSGLHALRGADPFQLGYTTRRHDGGTGIGLAYAKQIVEALGGTITLEENRPRGARAEVRLPLEMAGKG